METWLSVKWSHLFTYLFPLSCFYLPLVVPQWFILSLNFFSDISLSQIFFDWLMLLPISAFSNSVFLTVSILSNFLLLFQTYLSSTDFVFTLIFSPLLTVWSPHFYRSPLSLIPSVEPYWEGLDAGRYSPQPTSPQWVCQLLSPPCYCTLYKPLLHFGSTPAPQTPDLHASGQMSPQGNNNTGRGLPLMIDEESSS